MLGGVFYFIEVHVGHYSKCDCLFVDETGRPDPEFCVACRRDSDFDPIHHSNQVAGVQGYVDPTTDQSKVKTKLLKSVPCVYHLIGMKLQPTDAVPGNYPGKLPSSLLHHSRSTSDDDKIVAVAL